MSPRTLWRCVLQPEDRWKYKIRFCLLSSRPRSAAPLPLSPRSFSLAPRTVLPVEDRVSPRPDPPTAAGDQLAPGAPRHPAGAGERRRAACVAIKNIAVTKEIS